MPSASPSVARIKNVIEAMKACGLQPGAVRVAKDGSFTVEQARPVDAQAPAAPQSAPRWGQTG